ncbi:MAG TPA: peptidylprolyl isomerase [Anaeromyxobacter sp.]|nr:peptidylprolyl isomerase [Anaeromyxobacter sp.]
MTRPASLLVLAAALALPARDAGAQVIGLAARVNDGEISLERLERFFEERLQDQGRLPASIRSPSAYTAMKKEALEALVDRELLWQEARRRRRVASAREVDAAMATFREKVPDPARRRNLLEAAGFTEDAYAEYVRRELSIRRLVEKDLAPKVKVTAVEVRAFYERNPDRFTEPAAVRARHVLVKVPSDATPERRAEARERIEAVLASARGGSDFADLARAHSEDETAPSGGDLGWFPRGRMVPPFEAVAFALEPGAISDVVETQFGFHVVRVEERRAEVVHAEADVRDAIREQLRAEGVRKAVAERVAALRASATIEILIPL